MVSGFNYFKMHAVYKHAYLNTFLFLHSIFMLCIVKMSLKGVVGGCALNSHGNYIVDRGKSWKIHGIIILNFCGNPGDVGTLLYQSLKVNCYEVM